MKETVKMLFIMVVFMCAYGVVPVQSAPKEDNSKWSFSDLMEAAREMVATKGYKYALEFCELAVQKEPNNPEGYLNRGGILWLLDQKRKAIADEQKVLSLIKDNGKYDILYGACAHENLASMYLINGELDKAESEGRIAIKLSPDDGEVHEKLGDILEKNGKLQEALFHYERAKYLYDKNELFKNMQEMSEKILNLHVRISKR